MRQIVAITALVLSAAAATAQADVYRWVDAQGRAHYSDRWVPGSELVKVDRNPANPQAAAARRAEEQNRLSTMNDRIDARQEQQAATRAVNADVAAERDKQCKEAKSRYDQTIRARRLYRTGEDGEREYLTDAQAEEVRVKARAEWQTACAAAQ